MHWILQNVPEAANLARQGKLCFGTVDSWLIWKLSGGTTHAIEISNASRTLVFDIQKCEWDSEILSRFGIPPESLPEVVPSSGVIAEVDESLFGGSAPIAGAAGDQQAALFGQACFAPGMAKKHLRNWLLHDFQHREASDPFPKRTAHHHRLEAC